MLRAKVVIPAHADGWAHFTQGVEDVQRTFSGVGISDVLELAPMGEWIVPTVAAGSVAELSTQICCAT